MMDARMKALEVAKGAACDHLGIKEKSRRIFSGDFISD